MSKFWNAVGAGAAIGVGVYALNEAFGNNARVSFDMFAGTSSRWGACQDYGWRSTPCWNAQPRVCDWGFNGRASNAWAYRQGVADGYNVARYHQLPPYRGQYVPWWT